MTTARTEPERCERTDLLPDQCAHCAGHDDPAARAADLTVVATFAALQFTALRRT